MRHPRIWWAVCFFFAFCTLAMMINDREPPTRVGYPYGNLEATDGERLRVVLPVQRSLGRKCTATINRTLTKSDHATEVLVANQFLSAEAMEKREQDTPGYLVLDVLIPKGVIAGPAVLRTSNLYTCRYNPLTWIWPIEDNWDVKFRVNNRTPS